MTAHLEDVVAELRRTRAERDEAIAQQTATSEVLQAINASPGDLAPVFDAIVEKAVRLGEATGGGLWLVEGDVTRAVGGSGGNMPEPFIEFVASGAPVPLVELLGRNAQDRPFVQIADLQATKAYRNGAPFFVAGVELGGIRTWLGVPLLADGAVVGVFTLVRNEVRPFSDKQIALVQNFAVQAQIAMKNARLLDETRESLERQTATSEILRVISQSPTDARPVFESIVQTAVRLLRCDLVFVLLRDGATFGPAAVASPEGPLADVGPTNLPIDPNHNFPSRAILDKKKLHLPDWSLIDLPEHERNIRMIFGVNSALYLPLLHEGACIGLLTLVGKRPNIFGASEIAQAESFRDQALIAIQNARLFNETREALERQTGTAEILKVIAGSPSDVQPVFEAIATNSNRLIGGFSTAVLRFVGDALHLAAFTPTNAAADEVLKASFPRPLAEFPPFVLVRDGKTVQFVDTEAESGVPPLIRDLARLRGYRSMLFTPLMNHGAPIGMISVTRKEPGAFAAHHVQLLQTFADQAVIAIQNVALFNETQEALEQQKASADVLSVIGKSVSDAAPVFEEILGACQRLFGSDEIGIYAIGDDDMVRVAAWRGPRAGEVRNDVTPLAESVTGQIIRERRTHHIPDLKAEPNLSPAVRERVDRLGSASLVYAPMLWEGRGLGSILVVRSPPRPFSDREQALLQTFADQAVIAIQNARLFNEVQARTRDLEQSLQQQTATAEVLKVISRSTFDLDAVLTTLTDSARTLCGAANATVHMRDGDAMRLRAQTGCTPEFVAYLRDSPIHPNRKRGERTHIGRAASTAATVEIPDVLEARDFVLGDAPRLGNFRAILGVPLLREGRVEGVFSLARPEPGPFTPRQIELVRAFADQAVIAIENVRLFDEVQARTRDLSEALQQQTATADVLKVISRSVFDLQTVLDTLVESAYKLCGAGAGLLYLRGDEAFECKAIAGAGVGEAGQLFKGRPIRAGRGTAAERVIISGAVESVEDFFEDPEFDPKLKEAIRGAAATGSGLADLRSTLAVPMKRDDDVVGVLAIARSQTGPFPQRQIELLQTFADQAVIAIENARLFAEVQARTRDLTEALQQQTATADVLKVISRSAFDLQTVFDTLLGSAVALSGADSGVLGVRDGDAFRSKSFVNKSPDLVRFLAETPITPGPGSVMGRVALSGRIEWIEDTLEDTELSMRDVIRRTNDDRALVGVPLLREGRIEGAIVLGRREPGRFSARSIELTQTFADQAVIAIENVRLFEQVQARTRDLTEALEQQTATADVLKVISRSAFDLQAVLNTLTTSAVTLCGAANGLIYLKKGDAFHMEAATTATPDPEFLERLRRTPQQPGRGSLGGRILLTGEIQIVTDVQTDPDWDPVLKTTLRSLLGVPLKRDQEVLGALCVARPEPRGFNSRHIEILQTFADQAVIAIENVRLFDEVQARTRDLEESLAQQTATADVLKVISRSAFDLDTVLQTLVESAARLCNAPQGVIHLREGDVVRAKAMVGHSGELMQRLRDTPRKAGRESIVPRVMLSGRVEHIDDALTDEEFDLAGMDRNKLGFRALLGVPLLREGKVEGVFVVSSPKPGRFTDRQTELVQTFADQAVIAIENVRLFKEVQSKTEDLSEALLQQTATADVLKVISRSAFDLQAVFNTLIASAVELCGAFSGVICVRDGDVFRYRGSAGDGSSRGLLNYLEDHPATPGRGSIAGRVLLSGKVEAIPDRLEDPEFAVPLDSYGGAARSLLGVPLLRNDGVEGALVLTRKEPGHFTQRQIEIVQTFADQAVIAIENVRLFDEVQARTKELAASLDDLRKAQDRLIQSEKLASLGQLTAGIAHEIKNPLNFVNNFSALSRELIDELGEALENAPLDKTQRGEVEDLIGTVAANLDKVVQHGRRADSIVKNMLLHSREGSGERASVNINAMVEEALNLAYHGARAEKPGFNVTIAKTLDPNAGAADLYGQEMTRVLLNLASNGFYATTKRKQGEASADYEPTLTASTRDLGDRVEIVIRDNGTGIPDEVKAKMFNPFFTTKPAGEGTGLGLSLSHDIVVKQHGGTIEVATEPGAYTQFTIQLPRAAQGAPARPGAVQ